MPSELDIAVVGVGCRFPDAWNAEQFWSNIASGLVSMRELSDEQLRTSGVPDATLRSNDFVRIGTTLPGVADFAASFFGCTPREARAMDPQQRIFLEVCWEALELAGHPPEERGPRIGVFAGSAAGNYSAAMMALAVNKLGLAAAVDDLDRTVGGEPDFLTSRVAYRLGLRGPAVSVQAACSSSLYAVHFAALSLLAGECDIALAGGANVLEPLRGYRYVPGRGQSEDGYCRSFDIRASGTTYSSGVGVVALRLLADAQADGDPVLAVLRGTAVGNDGAHKAGWVAPSPGGVSDVVSAALRVAEVPPEAVRYVEAHGTATPIGDHIELAALTAALRTGERCGLGSVKVNIGHTGPASSIAGFINAVHVARTGWLPPHPMFEQPRDPELLAESPFDISTSARVVADNDRHVLINAIGFGGANAAAVLAAPPAPIRPLAAETATMRLVLSARTRVELDALSRDLADVIDRGEVPIPDLSHTLRVGRKPMPERRVVTAAPEALAAALRLPRPPAVVTMRSERKSGSAPSPADDAALTEAWLHGVEVDWESLAPGEGRRVALPTYPFTRERFWGLDGVSLSDLSSVRPESRGADDVERRVLAIWRDVLGREDIGLDHELDAAGGSSLSAVQIVIELQQAFGVLLNVHRAGGGRTTARTMANLMRELLADPDAGESSIDRLDAGEERLVDADLTLPLGPVRDTETRGRDMLITGATGYLGAFLLHQLQRSTPDRIYCLVRAADEDAGRARLRAAASRFLLPEPDFERVRVVPGDLRDIMRLGAGFADRVGHVLHSAARVVFTEPYRGLREDNVLALVELLNWMRDSGIRDLSFVSTAAATMPPRGGTRALETRDQGLDPRLGGYGASKWVGERLLDRAEGDGLRVRVFRPGLIMSDSTSGAGNDKDLIAFTLVSGLAVGAHPTDERTHAMAPVDVMARAIVDIGRSPGSVGRAYHLMAPQAVSLRGMFELLAEAGLPTKPLPLDEWRDLVRDRAVATGNAILSATALLEIEGGAADAGPLQASGWQPWLRRNGIDPAVTGVMLRRGLAFLARGNPLIGALLPELVAEGVTG